MDESNSYLVLGLLANSTAKTNPGSGSVASDSGIIAGRARALRAVTTQNLVTSFWIHLAFNSDIKVGIFGHGLDGNETSHREFVILATNLDRGKAIGKQYHTDTPILDTFIDRTVLQIKRINGLTNVLRQL